MKTTLISLALLSLALWLANCKQPAKTAAVADPNAASRNQYVAAVNARIKGKEQVLVDSVFQNLQTLGGFPAENLVFAMDKWAQALGVDCTHCHNPADWASDEKPQKAIARQMVGLGEMVNTELRKIPGLKSQRPLVNCITCHRGSLKPAVRMQ